MNIYVFHDWTMFSNIDLTTKPFFFNTVFFSMTPMIDWAVLLQEKSKDGHS